jgi:hypothetical protein
MQRTPAAGMRAAPGEAVMAEHGPQAGEQRVPHAIALEVDHHGACAGGLRIGGD